MVRVLVVSPLASPPNTIPAAAQVLLPLAVSASHCQDDVSDADGWAWSVTPYMWFTDTNLRLTADGQSVGDVDISFSDLLDTIDTAYQIVVETGPKAGKWSAFVDLTYLETSDNLTVPTNVGDIRIDTDSDQLFIDAAVAYWPMGFGNNFNVYGGMRYTDLEDQFKIKDAR